MPELDDTQPHSPLRAAQTASSTQETSATYSPDDDDMGSGGPGCLIWSLVLVVIVIFAVVIVIFAALAGWSSGQQIVRVGATATQEHANAEQCARLEGDVLAGNRVLLQARMESLLTQTPPVPCVIPYIPTATALYFNSLPTATATATDIPTITATMEITATIVPVATTDSAFNTESLLQEAQAYMQSNEWEEAISTLDAIISIDPTFRLSVVEDMLFRALTERALQLYRNGENLARAVVLTDRAETIRPVGNLGFERTVAQLWLDAQRSLNISYPEAIRLLRQVVQFSPNYMNGEAARQLYRQTIAYADSLVAGGEPCAAVIQYDAAIALRGGDAETTGKRTAAQTACIQLTTVPGGVVTTQEVGQPTSDSGAPPTATIAPVGQQ